MPICEEHKLLFYHIPKTGGGAIKDFFDLERGGHNTYDFYRKKLESQGKDIKDYKKFTVLRYPVSRYISAWKHYAIGNKERPTSPDDPFKKKYFSDPRAQDLNYFTEHIFNEEVFTQVPHFRSFCCYLGELGDAYQNEAHVQKQPVKIVGKPIDYILRQEHLEEDLQLLLKIENIDSDRKLNVIRNIEAPGQSLSQEMEDKVNWMYKVDYRIMDYYHRAGFFVGVDYNSLRAYSRPWRWEAAAQSNQASREAPPKQ